ncbi:hypothetical protein ACIBCH_36670 [Amycolatopsis thailandensis]|uniref:hypothetical protein n=1 Tax=Amycolatopsis thailandensis TaxID=589330 RepID=UPI0037878C4E
MDLQERGTRLWSSLLTKDTTLEDESNPMREVALSACRTADVVDRLERMAAQVDPLVEVRGGLVTHPVLVEVRHQSALLARLVSSLRLPDTAGVRPQRRALRGVYPQGVSSLDQARKSALERAKDRHSGSAS